MLENTVVPNVIWTYPIIPAITFSSTAIRGTLALSVSFAGAEPWRFAQIVNSALHARARRERKDRLVGVGGREVQVWTFLEAEIVLPDELGHIEERFVARRLVML